MKAKKTTSSKPNFTHSKTSPSKKSRVLVTGATGFLGRHLVPALLTQDYQVTCLVRHDPGPGLWADCTMIFGDLRESGIIEQAVKDIDVVIHAAAVVNAKDPLEYSSINVEGTRILLSRAHHAGVKHFIFLSSVDIGHGTLYGTSKEQGESLVKSSGIPYTILRPGPIYGEGDNKNIMELFDLVRTKSLIPVIGDGNYLRQPIHVTDVCQSILAVIGSAKSFGKTYYLGGPSITYNDILAAMIEASDHRPTIVHLPAGLAKVFVMAINKFGLGPRISNDQIRTIDHDKIGDITTIAHDFGVRARPFQEGFTQQLAGLHDLSSTFPKRKKSTRQSTKRT